MPYTPTRIPVDQIGVEERVARFKTRSIKKESKVQAIKLAMSMIDLTTLEGKDSDEKVKQLCRKAIHPCESMDDVPSVAAVCVYPTFVRTAKEALRGSTVKVASVATGFPAGNVPLQAKIDDTKFALAEGADEIDMVISRGKFLSGDYDFVFNEITTLKKLCGDVHLKVILETGELESYENIRLASDLAMEAGADFIKTSTGKVEPAATMPVTLVMLEAIRDYYYRTGRMVGMKPAGGIRKEKEALQYLVMLRETLGEAWLSPDYFRFGASALANDLLMQLQKQTVGYYQSLDYFSID